MTTNFINHQKALFMFPALPFAPGCPSDAYRLPGARTEGKNAPFMLAFGVLEWSFLAALVALVGAAGIFGLYVLMQLFRNPRRKMRAR